MRTFLLHKQKPIVQKMKTYFAAGEAMQGDAALFCATPDLLDALESLAVWNNDEPCFCHVHGEADRARYSRHDSYCDKARLAIKKAKGET